jgi:hypothetical protein
MLQRRIVLLYLSVSALVCTFVLLRTRYPLAVYVYMLMTLGPGGRNGVLTFLRRSHKSFIRDLVQSGEEPDIEVLVEPHLILRL